MPQTTETPLARMIRARAGLLQATLRKTRPRTDLIPVVTKLDAAIRALEAQRTRPRSSSIAFRGGGHPSLRRGRMTRLMLKIDEDAMRLDEANIRRIRRRVR
jgi:hypothetical protein